MAVALLPRDLSRPPAFDLTGESASVGVRWKRRKKGFMYYLDARGITQVKQDKALLLHSAGTDVQDIFEKLTGPGHADSEENDTHNDYEKSLRTFDAYFLPTTNEPYDRHIFHRMRQQENETVDRFVARLRKQDQNCGYGTELNDHIRDQVVDWCKSMPIRRNLLGKGSKLNLQLAQQIARTMEAVDMQLAAMNTGMTRSQQTKSEVNHVQARMWSVPRSNP